MDPSSIRSSNHPRPHQLLLLERGPVVQEWHHIGTRGRSWRCGPTHTLHTITRPALTTRTHTPPPATTPPNALRYTTIAQVRAWEEDNVRTNQRGSITQLDLYTHCHKGFCTPKAHTNRFQKKKKLLEGFFPLHAFLPSSWDWKN